MKLSIVSGLDESNKKQEDIYDKFLNVCETISQFDYNGIELELLEPERLSASKINEIKQSYDLEISAVDTNNIFIRFGFSLGHNDEYMRKKAIERLEKYISFASEINSKVIIGLIRGRYNSLSSLKREKLNIKTSLKSCVHLAEKNNITLLFEPINRFEVDSFNTITESVELLEEIDSDYLRLLINTFHTHLEEDPILIWDFLPQVAPLVSHIHLADCTRRAPGTGHFDFRAFLNVFKNAGYNDYISVDTIMKPSFEEVAKDTAQYLSVIL
ncbi:MAG: sugar phosphate isomerase/epimerase [Promethearchaeota archaeon]|nr:MAG: sugar phosphate isomerase/epimerase [Candidatus Lokiarchaeota archaeon]